MVSFFGKIFGSDSDETKSQSSPQKNKGANTQSNIEDLKNQKAQLEQQYNFDAAVKDNKNKMDSAYSYINVVNKLFLKIRDEQGMKITDFQYSNLHEYKNEVDNLLNQRSNNLNNAISNAKQISALNEQIYKSDNKTLKNLNSTLNNQIKELDQKLNFIGNEFATSYNGLNEAIDHYSKNPNMVIKSASQVHNTQQNNRSYAPNFTPQQHSANQHTR